MNKPPSIIERLMTPDPVLFWAYLLPVIYWTYLTLTANFVLIFDSEGYFSLAKMFSDGQWIQYFKTGPNREPFYPLMVAASLMTAKIFGISYIYTVKIISFGFLAATMLAIQKVLKVLGSNRWITAAAILYTGFSPILINSALCLYSEIATFPWLVAAVLFSIYFLRSLQGPRSGNFAPAILLSFCLLGFTFVKAIGELLCPLFLSWVLFYAWRRSGLRMFAFLSRSKLNILALILAFTLPLLGFKSLNYFFNGHFSLTNRAEMVLYGPLVQRAQSPLTIRNLLIHLSTATPSYPLCSNYFPDDDCSYWYRDPFYFIQDFQKEIIDKKLPQPQIDRIIHHKMFQAFLGNPFKQLIYMFEEGLKMFFWETTRGSFVAYPPWLESLFYIKTVVVLMTLGAGFFCLAGFIASLTLLKNEVILMTVVMTSLLIFVSSICNIISRYTIVAGPLMILLNAACLSMLIARCRRK